MRKEPYVHARYETIRRFLRFLIRVIGYTFLAKLDRVEGLENIPKEGPAIFMMNHIAFIDSITVLHAASRNIVPMAKIEVYNYPIIGIFPRLWHVIPVMREGVDRQAIRLAMDVLEAGEIVLVAPEGTRGPALQEGREGAAYLASRTGAPIIPVSVVGTKGQPALRGTKRWKEPGAVVTFGKPFTYKPEYRSARREDLRKMTDEAMYILAAMLPPHLRGFYSDPEKATRETIL